MNLTSQVNSLAWIHATGNGSKGFKEISSLCLCLSWLNESYDLSATLLPRFLVLDAIHLESLGK